MQVAVHEQYSVERITQLVVTAPPAVTATKETTVRDWELHSVLAEDAGVQLSERDKQASRILPRQDSSQTIEPDMFLASKVPTKQYVIVHWLSRTNKP